MQSHKNFKIKTTQKAHFRLKTIQNIKINILLVKKPTWVFLGFKRVSNLHSAPKSISLLIFDKW